MVELPKGATEALPQGTEQPSPILSPPSLSRRQQPTVHPLSRYLVNIAPNWTATLTNAVLVIMP